MRTVLRRPNFLPRDRAIALHAPTRRLLAVVVATYALLAAALGAADWTWAMPQAGRLSGAALSFLAVGLLQFVLLHATHEASHQDFHRPWRTLAAFLVAYPIGLTQSFRDEHLRHHRRFGDPSVDPDFPTYAAFPSSRWAMLRWLAYNFSGTAAVDQVLRRSKSSHPERKNPADGLLLVATQAAIFLAFTSLLTPWHYLTHWLAPLLTVVKGLAQVRGLTEHGSFSSGGPSLRSFQGQGPADRLLGCIGFRHHAEHHLYPMVPFEKLPEVRERMLRAPDDARGVAVEVHPGGHLDLLRAWFTALPWTRPAGSQR